MRLKGNKIFHAQHDQPILGSFCWVSLHTAMYDWSLRSTYQSHWLSSLPWYLLPFSRRSPGCRMVEVSKIILLLISLILLVHCSQTGGWFGIFRLLMSPLEKLLFFSIWTNIYSVEITGAWGLSIIGTNQTLEDNKTKGRNRNRPTSRVLTSSCNHKVFFVLFFTGILHFVVFPLWLSLPFVWSAAALTELIGLIQIKIEGVAKVILPPPDCASSQCSTLTVFLEELIPQIHKD